MSRLTALRTAATAKLATVEPVVLSYIAALEAKAKLSLPWLGGAFVLGCVVGGAVVHHFTHHG